MCALTRPVVSAGGLGAHGEDCLRGGIGWTALIRTLLSDGRCHCCRAGRRTVSCCRYTILAAGQGGVQVHGEEEQEYPGHHPLLTGAGEIIGGLRDARVD